MAGSGPLARLDEGLARGLVLICAPAGYGKTVRPGGARCRGLTAFGIALAGLVIAVITIRVRREDLTGTPEPAQDRHRARGRASPFVTLVPRRRTT